MDTKIQEFSEVPFQCIFNEFGFLLDISSKINLHVWFYFIVFLTILYITLETGHMESSILLSLSASCCIWYKNLFTMPIIVTIPLIKLKTKINQNHKSVEVVII